MTRHTLMGIGGAGTAALLWGSWFPLSRLMVRHETMSPEDVAYLRFLIAAIVLLPVVWRHGLKAGRAGWLGTIAMTVTVGFPFAFLITTGLQYAPAAHAAMFVPGVFPALTFVLGILVLKDPARWRGMLGTALVLAGVLGVGSTSLAGDSGGAWQGYALFMVCASMWAVYSIFARLAAISATHGVAIISVLSIAAVTPVYLLYGDVRLFTLPVEVLVIQVIYQGFGIGLVALIGYNYAINTLGAAQAAVFGGLVPCVAAVLAVPVLGEALGLVEIAGIAAVTAGVLLVNGARLPLWRRPAPAGKS